MCTFRLIVYGCDAQKTIYIYRLDNIENVTRNEKKKKKTYFLKESCIQRQSIYLKNIIIINNVRDLV